MALTEISEVARLGHEALLDFGIDSPQPGDAIPGYGLDLRGWALGREHRATAVELVQDGVLLRRLPQDVARADLAELYPEAPGVDAGGFFASIGVLNLRPSFELLVRVRLEDKTRAPLATIRGTRSELHTAFEPRIQPLMLTTLGRTGSTAVVRLLGSHPEVVAYRPFEYEPRVATYWMGVLKGLAEPGSYRRQIAPAGPIDGAWWLGADPPSPRPIKDPPVQAWLAGQGVEDLAAFCQHRVEDLYLEIAKVTDQPRAAYFVEKFRPDAVPALVSELYPEAREVVLVRDFRDMLASMFAYNEKRGIQGFRRDHAETDADYVMERIRGSVGALVSAWESRKERAHLLRYEDLVLRPTETVEALLEHLSLDAGASTVEAMLASIATPETEGHRTVADPRQTIGRWRKDLTPELQAVCSEALGPSLQALGYTDDGA